MPDPCTPNTDIPDIVYIREKIDLIDEKLVRELCERARLMPLVRRWKDAHLMPILDTKREQDKLNKIKEMVKERDLPPIYVTPIFREIMNIGACIQRGFAPDSSRVKRLWCITCKWHTGGVTEPILGLQVCIVCGNPLI